VCNGFVSVATAIRSAFDAWLSHTCARAASLRDIILIDIHTRSDQGGNPRDQRYAAAVRRDRRPRSGKTTLIDALAQAGCARSIEAGRGVIQDQMAVGGPALAWRDPKAFAELMLCWEMRSYHLAQEQAGPIFFDRGVPDVIGYLRMLGLPVPQHMEEAAAIFRYQRRVFIAPPWPDIFRQDSERRQSLDEAV